MIVRNGLVILALVVLAACGGGSGSTADGPMTAPVTPPQTADDTPAMQSDTDPVDMPNDPAPTPPVVDVTAPDLRATLADLDTNEVVISAAVLVTDPDTGDRSVLTRDGLYARIDATLSLANANVTLTDDVMGTFENAASFSQSDAVGIVGLATPLADLRTVGDAQFVGGAAGFVIDGADGADLINGTSTVDVIFSTGTVNVTLDDFDAVSQTTGVAVDSPITEMTLMNASISGTGFSGGSFVVRDADGMIDLTGANTVTISQGQFFGLDPDGETPDEVGGVILSEGDSGIVYGTFVAD